MSETAMVNIIRDSMSRSKDAWSLIEAIVSSESYRGCTGSEKSQQGLPRTGDVVIRAACYLSGIINMITLFS
jgi:hypothetical protein